MYFDTTVFSLVFFIVASDPKNSLLFLVKIIQFTNCVRQSIKILSILSHLMREITLFRQAKKKTCEIGRGKEIGS